MGRCSWSWLISKSCSFVVHRISFILLNLRLDVIDHFLRELASGVQWLGSACELRFGFLPRFGWAWVFENDTLSAECGLFQHKAGECCSWAFDGHQLRQFGLTASCPNNAAVYCSSNACLQQADFYIAAVYLPEWYESAASASFWHGLFFRFFLRVVWVCGALGSAWLCAWRREWLSLGLGCFAFEWFCHHAEGNTFELVFVNQFTVVHIG